MNRPSLRSLLQSWPFLTLGLLAAVFVLMLLFSRKAPVIATLEPEMALPGQQVTMTGDYFGRTEREGTLSIAGEIPPPSLIKSWSDQKIVFVVPEDASSGLVTVSNSQGTSTGVLFTNTESIPTVLQTAAAPGMPLVLSAVPGVPAAGQTVTLSGRAFGPGGDGAFVRVSVGGGGPALEIGPADSLVWTDRTVSFRWPAGAGALASLQVVTPRGESAPFALAGTGPTAFAEPRTLTVEVKAVLTLPAATAVNLWAPVPGLASGTVWSLASSDPPPVSGSWPPLFSWAPGPGGERTLTYKLTLTSWARRWDGPPAGPAGPGTDTPAGDPRPRDWWKGSAPVLKVLTAKWGLETPDPWLRILRIQEGLTAAFRFDPADAGLPNGARAVSLALAGGRLGSYEASSLAAYLAGQTGIPVRLVSGLWKGPSGLLVPRVWAEAWVPGAGWVSWDVIDGSPGSLDNRHFAFETDLRAPLRRLARSKTFGPPVPSGLGNPSGEAAGPGPEPVVRWEITEVEK